MLDVYVCVLVVVHVLLCNLYCCDSHSQLTAVGKGPGALCTNMHRCYAIVRVFVRHVQVLCHCEGVCQTCTGVAPL